MTLPTADALSMISRIGPNSPARAAAGGPGAEGSFMDWMRATQTAGASVNTQGDGAEPALGHTRGERPHHHDGDNQRVQRQREGERAQQANRRRQQAADEAQRRRSAGDRLADQRAAEASTSRRRDSQPAAATGRPAPDTAPPSRRARPSADEPRTDTGQAPQPADAVPANQANGNPTQPNPGGLAAGDGGTRTDAAMATAETAMADERPAGAGTGAAPALAAGAANATDPGTVSRAGASSAAGQEADLGTGQEAGQQMGRATIGALAEEAGGATPSGARLSDTDDGGAAAGDVVDPAESDGHAHPGGQAPTTAASRAASEPGAAQRAVFDVQRATAMQAASAAGADTQDSAPPPDGRRASRGAPVPAGQLTSTAALARQFAAAGAATAGKPAADSAAGPMGDGKIPADDQGERLSTFQSVTATLGLEAARDGSALTMTAQAAQAGRGFDVRAAAPTVTTAIAVPVDHPEFAEALARQSATLALQGQQRADIEVTPPDMGPIRIRIEMGTEGATIGFSAEQAATRQAIEASLATLRGLLADQGVRMADARIDGGSSGNADSGRGWQSADTGAANSQQLPQHSGPGNHSNGTGSSDQGRAGDARANGGTTLARDAGGRPMADSAGTGGSTAMAGGAGARRIDLYA